MKLKRARQTTLIALIVAISTLGFAPSAFADSWLGYGDNFTSKQTCLNRGAYLLSAQPYAPGTFFLDYFCQKSWIDGRWSLVMLVKDDYGCFVARDEDAQRAQSETLSQVAVPTGC